MAANRTFYYSKDINYIAQEPIVNKFRDFKVRNLKLNEWVDVLIKILNIFKVYVKRLKRARGRGERKQAAELRNNKPFYKIDHIVTERYELKINNTWHFIFILIIYFSRYPTFIDAVRDLDDCLSLIFLFATLPKSKRVYVERVELARRLSCMILFNL